MKNPLIMNMEPGEEETMKAMTSSSAKMAATCEEKVHEDLQGTVDRVTKKLHQKVVLKKWVLRSTELKEAPQQRQIKKQRLSRIKNKP